MHLELIKTSKGNYKIISRSNHKHPALEHLGRLLWQANKSCPVKIGVYNIVSRPFATYKTVYSYVSDRTQKMCKRYYYEFIKGRK